MPHNQVLSYGATVHFVLMDYDFLKNDFGGEAYLQINDVPGVHGKKSKNLGEESPISLHLLPGVTKGTAHFFIGNIQDLTELMIMIITVESHVALVSGT